MLRQILTMVVVLVAMELIHSDVPAREYHVSVAGDNAGDGSERNPLKTISAAAQLAVPGDVVTVHAGTYRERVTPPRGGESDNLRIVYRAAESEKAVIAGSEVIKGWEKVQGNVWKVALPNAFFGDYNPYADLIRGDWFDPQGREHHTGDVYLNGKSRWEAARLQDVLEPKDRHPRWYGKANTQNTVIWADFEGADPNAELVEINVRPVCFYPGKTGVNYISVCGFTMRQAATQWAPPTAEQIGLIGTNWSKGWIIENNIISDSRCSGITLGKYRDAEDKLEASADQYNGTVRRALERGWSKENIGSHIVRNNTISHCEQTGICGSMGAIFSVVTGNHIHDIWVQRQFGGAEMAGIKFHGAIDTLIGKNCIHNAGRGLWLDWMTQGARVTGNLLYDNSTDDVLVEVSHGPYLFDNNIMLSPRAILDVSQGGAYVHNLIAGDVCPVPEMSRSTPFHKPHSTELAGLSKTMGGDDRWYNNVFIGHSGLSPYDKAVLPVYMGGNVFLGGAKPSKYEKNSIVIPQIKPAVEVVEKPDGVYLRMEVGQAWNADRPTQLVTSELLGKAKIPGQGYTNPNGSPLPIDADYFGKRRDKNNPGVGPFAQLEGATVELKVWP